MKNLLVMLLLLSVLAGCGGGGDSHPATLTSITVSAAASTIAPTTTTTANALGHYSNGTTADVTNTATWSSSAPSVVDVSNAAGSKGVVTAGNTTGTSTITATVGGISGQTALTSADVQSISVSRQTGTMIVGATQPLTATATLIGGATQDVTPSVTWTSSDQNAATVSSSGVVTAGPGTGTTTITAQFRGASATTDLSTKAVTSITLTPAGSTVDLGATQQMVATATFSDGSQPSDVSTLVTWTSTTPAVASVGATGLVTTRAPGSTTIGASFAGVTAIPVALNVLAPTSIVVTPATSSAVVNSTVQFTATGTFNHTGGQTTEDLTRLVTWSSNPTGIFVTSATPGLATVGGAGAVNVTATLPGTGIAGSTTLTVLTVTALNILPATPSVALHSTLQLTAQGTLSDGSTEDLTNSVNWSSSAAAVASVTNAAQKGIVTGNALGTATITATFGSGVSAATATTTVTVTTSGGASGAFAFVTNFGSNTVSVVDVGSNTLVTNVAVGAGPQGIAYNSGLGIAYVANSNSNTVTMIAVGTSSTFTTTNATAGNAPWGVAINPANNRVYVTNNQSNSVTVLDSNGALRATIPVGAGPKGVTVSGSGSRVYVANSNADTVSVVDTSSNTVISTISLTLVGAGVNDVAFDPTTGNLLVVNSNNQTVAVVDPINALIQAQIPVGSNPQRITRNLVSGRAYVTNRFSGTVSVIDTGTATVVTTITLGGQPQGITQRSSTNRLYVANAGTNTLDIIDTTNNTVVGHVNVQGQPTDVAVVP